MDSLCDYMLIDLACTYIEFYRLFLCTKRFVKLIHNNPSILKTIKDTVIVTKKHCDGQICTYKGGMLHSCGDSPAVIYLDGSKEWYNAGKLHRNNDLPAAIYTNNHRIDINIHPSMYQAHLDTPNTLMGGFLWYQNGKLHRENKPAYTNAHINSRWFVNDKLHNADSHAVEWDAMSDLEYWIDGEFQYWSRNM